MTQDVQSQSSMKIHSNKFQTTETFQSHNFPIYSFHPVQVNELMSKVQLQ